MTRDHDTGYKLLFGHPEMVRDLLQDWVPGEWLAEADFSTLERINSSYVSESQKERHDDMVWRLRLNDRWLWVSLLLEFQSEPDRWMALRLLVYLGLLAQDLVRRDDLADGKLPPILPLVLYNGMAPWHAPRDAGDLFAPAPASLAAYRPRLTYHLIDEARLQLHPTASVRNAVDALFRLEHGRTPEDLLRVLQALGHLLRDPAQSSLRRSFTLWVKTLLRRKAASPSMTDDLDKMSDLLEGKHMLAERIESWFDEATRKGVQQGLQQGRLAGEARLLARQLERRFGALPPVVVERLTHATENELETWSDAVLTAPTLEAVFASTPH
mgnify:CR=1 FL=1